MSVLLVECLPLNKVLLEHQQLETDLWAQGPQIKLYN